MSKKNKENDSNTRDRIIQIILIIIIILLLLHNCSLIKKKDEGKKDEGKIHIVDFTDDDCEQLDVNSIDCLQNPNNSQCFVPDFTGKTKKELLKWLNSISNTIEIEIKLVENPNYPDGTILSQSVVGVSINDLLEKKTKLVITIVNNGSLVDCEKNSTNSKCLLPNFTNKTTNDVENWASKIANHVNVKYIYVDSNQPSGIITGQSIKEGTPVKDILNQNQTLVIYISKGDDSTNPFTSDSTSNTSTPNSNNSNNDNNKDDTNPSDEPQEPELDGDFYVSDDKIAKWHNETDLNIFEDSTNISKVRGKIAPESSGTYKFIVNNGTRYNLKYSISFIETNQYNINMKYKLKKGNTYLIDHYVSYDELDIDNVILNTASSDTYYLEWKWVGDNDGNDTQIGKTASSSNVRYDLKIDVEAESVS